MQEIKGVKFLTISEVCRKFSISSMTLRKWCLPQVKLGRNIFYDETDIENYIENGKKIRQRKTRDLNKYNKITIKDRKGKERVIYRKKDNDDFKLENGEKNK